MIRVPAPGSLSTREVRAERLRARAHVREAVVPAFRSPGRLEASPIVRQLEADRIGIGIQPHPGMRRGGVAGDVAQRLPRQGQQLGDGLDRQVDGSVVVGHRDLDVDAPAAPQFGGEVSKAIGERAAVHAGPAEGRR